MDICFEIKQIKKQLSDRTEAGILIMCEMGEKCKI